MELSDCSLSVNIAEITEHGYYFGLALINNCLAFSRFCQAGENPVKTSLQTE